MVRAAGLWAAPGTVAAPLFREVPGSEGLAVPGTATSPLFREAPPWTQGCGPPLARTRPPYSVRPLDAKVQVEGQRAAPGTDAAPLDARVRVTGQLAAPATAAAPLQ